MIHRPQAQVAFQRPKDPFDLQQLLVAQGDISGRQLIVADPCRIQLSRFADVAVHHRLGTDVALLNDMLQIIIENN